ncbi:hypothetical protein PENTCL1PPCAC_21124, partial [Pristionchus entomophagus]
SFFSMPKVIALTSKSTRLHISLHNDNCDFSITDDRASLLFDTVNNSAISSIHVQLNCQGRLIHSFKFPCHTRGRVSSVRLDPIYPFVFKDSEPIGSVITSTAEFLANGDCETTYGLRIKLHFDRDLPLPTLTLINSVLLNIESTVVHVSKEVLAINSDYFCTIFYKEFLEKSSGLFCIKEVDGDDFVWFIDSIVKKRWDIESVDHALAALIFADRFCMPDVFKRILPYLKNAELDSVAEKRVATLKRYIDLAARRNDNGDFMSWIFEKCQTMAQLIEVAQSCGDGLNPHMAIFFRFLANEEKKATEKIARFEKKRDKLKRRKNDYKIAYFFHAHRGGAISAETAESE